MKIRITDLQQENKQLKEQIEELKLEIQELKDDIAWWQNRFNAENKIAFENFKPRIDKAIEEIECEIEQYDGSNEDFISVSWVEMKTDDYIAKLKNILKILGGKEND